MMGLKQSKLTSYTLLIGLLKMEKLRKKIILFVLALLLFQANVANAWVWGLSVMQMITASSVAVVTQQLSKAEYGESIHARMNVHFLSGSSKIETQYSRDILDSFGSSIRNYKKDTGDEIRIIIAGFTDNKGNKSENIRLSKKRANYIALYLINNYGFKQEEIKIEAYGQEHPVASNETKEGRQKNRRIEFQMLKLKRIEES